MSIKEPSRVLEEISQEQVRQDLSLLPGILIKIQQENQAARKTSTRLRFAILLLVIVMLVTLFSRPGVASALKKIIGFIPGVGTVDQSAPLRVLAKPVTVTRDGFTLTVESAVLDSTRTVLNFTITGTFPAWADPSLKPRMCQEQPILRLAGGKVLTNTSSESGLGGGKSNWQIVFPAIPAIETHASLVLHCLTELPLSEGPQNWEIPLIFVPAPPEMTIFPVFVVPTPMPSNPEATASENQMQFILQNTSTLENGYFLQTFLTWQKDPAINEVQVYPDAVHMVDAAGQEVPISFADQTPPFAPAENQSIPLSLQTALISAPGPARLVMDYVGVSMFASTSFSFNVGDNPQPGQTWQLDKDLEVNGHRLRVRSAEYIQAAPGEPAMLMVYLEAGSDILAVSAMDIEHQILDAGGSPNSEQVPFRAGWHYRDGFPQGKITVEITRITLRRQGPWFIHWTPPVVTSTLTPTPTVPAVAPWGQPATCSSEKLLQTPLNELPVGLSGRVAFSEWNGEKHGLIVSNLDGSDRIPLGIGALADLSPDGKRVAYLGADDGLHVREVSSGTDLLIPGTIHENIHDNWPRWSPDGLMIAFERITGHTSDIYLVNPDGTNMHPVLNSAEDERFLGWSPDSQHLSYLVTGSNGQTIRVLHMQDNRSSEVGQLPPGGINASLSPDGKRWLYTNEQGMFLVTINHPDPVLLIASGPNFGNQIHPIWSPDNQWIAMTYWESAENSQPRLALLQPDTCQFIFVSGQKAGWLSSWVP